MIKDYYSILGVTPLSTTDEVRRSYRKLAKQWHPDQQSEDPTAALRFQEVKEAYEILTDPIRKDAWLQDRWQLRSMGKDPQGTPSPWPTDLLKACIALEQEVSLTDPHRADAHALMKRIQKMLTADAVELLVKVPEATIRQGVCLRLLRCGAHFRPALAEQLTRLLQPVAGPDAELSAAVQRYRLRSRRRASIEMLRWPLLLLATALACLLIARA
ncbi:MAG: hypothetical protein FJX89_03150 [Bacteroidetes bacterium]|nr:hypothetical protein [Bacteroidota bacterium]